MASPSVIAARPSYEQSVHPPVTLSMTHQSATQPVSPANRPSDCSSLSDRLYSILPWPSGCPTSSDHTSTIYTCPSDHPPPNCLTATTTRLPVRLLSPMTHLTQDSIHSLAVVNGEQSHTIHHTQDSSQSLAVVNGVQSHKAKKFHRAFTNYDLPVHALDASSIYLRDLRRVAPPQSGEDAHATCGKCDFGGATLNNPSLGFCYVLPRL